jgi:hypothetical protein
MEFEQAKNGLPELFAAAVVNQQFRDMLLADPATAIQNGYLGKPFSLTQDQVDILISIRGANIGDYARQVNKALGVDTEG